MSVYQRGPTLSERRAVQAAEGLVDGKQDSRDQDSGGRRRVPDRAEPVVRWPVCAGHGGGRISGRAQRRHEYEQRQHDPAMVSVSLMVTHQYRTIPHGVSRP